MIVVNGVVTMAKKSTTIRIEDTLIKGLNYLVYKNETTKTDLINKYIKDGLKNDGVNLEELEIN